ncbi:hypothetical protein HDU80_009214 [Chytriomyces hyalinus]|nr:hypothetical protein HDU80_009214 [Chytriomyces hyalinus]
MLNKLRKTFTNASKLEDPLALYHMYEHGMSVENDYSKAFEFYDRAAKQKHGAAILHVVFPDKSVNQAAEFYQKSASFGDGVGAFNSGLVFENGHGKGKIPDSKIAAFSGNKLNAFQAVFLFISS